MGPRFVDLRVAFARSPAVLPTLVMIAVLVVLAAADGGYYPTAWIPAALVAVGLLAMALWAVPRRSTTPKTVTAAVALLAAYAGWSYLSILWASDPGVAWEGANRSLMYAVVFALLALWPLRGAAAAAVVGAFGLGVAVLGALTLARALTAADPTELLVFGRLFEPVGYVNGNVALWFSGFFPCLLLAARRELPAPLRAAGLGGASLLLGLTLLGQSRGWLFTVPLALTAWLILTPGRGRGVAALAAAGAGLAASLGPILGVYEAAVDGEPVAAALEVAAVRMLTVAGALVAVGLVVAIADRRVELSSATARGVRIATVGAALLLTALGTGVALASVDDPVGGASEAIEEFRSGEGDQAGGTRLAGSLATNRYDLWRVAVGQFEAAPLLGAGADNFQAAYLREGATTERPQFPHSVELRTLSQTGLMGVLLLGGALAAAAVGAVGAIRRRSPLAAAAAGTALATFVYWLLHGSVDWFYELPGLAAPAFALLGLSAGLAPRAPDGRSRPEARPIADGRGRRAAVLAGAAAAAAALVLPLLSALQVERALEEASADPGAALQRLDSAAALNPLSIEPHATAGAIALRLDLPEAARERFAAVLERDPDNAYATLQLGALASERGEDQAALGLIARALLLSPSDGVAGASLRRLLAGETLDPERVYDQAIDRRRALTGG